MRGRGGSKAVWNFSENSSILEGKGVPYRETDANIGKRVVQDNNNDRWFWPWGQWTSWCTFGGARWQTVVNQSAFLTVTNLSTLGTAALHQIILIGTPECISCNSFWIAFPFLTMHTSHWGQIGLALHWTLLHASEPVQGAFLAIWWSLLGFPCTAVEYQITPSLHPEPRDGGCIFTKWAEPGNATASGLNEKPPKCTISHFHFHFCLFFSIHIVHWRI